jgi:hypothetical protein
MKTRIKTMSAVIAVIALTLGLSFTSCNKDEVTPLTPISLELTLHDNLGNIISGAAVKLYTSQTDWSNGTNQFGSTQFSDVSGRVKFSDLSSMYYYWFAEKDCYNNVNGGVTTILPLTANKNNTYDIVLTSTGTMKFVSTSSNPYRVFINGTAVFDMDGGSTRYIYYKPTGSYTVRVLQLSGYVLYPTDETGSGNVSCGSTLTTTFPW